MKFSYSIFDVIVSSISRLIVLCPFPSYRSMSLFSPRGTFSPCRLSTFRHKQLKYLGASGAARSPVNIQRATCHRHSTAMTSRPPNSPQLIPRNPTPHPLPAVHLLAYCLFAVHMCFMCVCLSACHLLLISFPSRRTPPQAHCCCRRETDGAAV